MHLLSFVGTADGQLASQGAGPIITAVRELKPSLVTLIVTEGPGIEQDYVAMSTAVKKAIAEVHPGVSVARRFMELNDPTDHNEIYHQLRDLTRSLTKKHPDMVAAISSGTPSMQVCWILLAESGDAPISLVRTSEPRFGRPPVQPVRLDVGLPRIQAMAALEREHAELLSIAIPTVTVNVQRGLVLFNDQIVPLSPRMFSYYRFFLEKARQQKGSRFYLEVRGVFVSGSFTKAIVDYHNESFPEKEDIEIVRLQKGAYEIQASAFRSTVTKLNDRIREHVPDQRIHQHLMIQAVGPKSARQYFVALPPDNIAIKTR